MVDLHVLKEEIESISKFHQIEILKILKKNASFALNENKNGVFINMTSVDKNTIDQLTQYLKYVNTQEKQLNEIENEKNTLSSKYFNYDKDNKDNNIICIDANDTF